MPCVTPSTRRRVEPGGKTHMTTTTRSTTATTRGEARRQATADSKYKPKDGLLLEVDDLFVEFHTDDGVAKAINGVSFDLYQGEALAVLGESGSGKSVTAQAIMGILDIPPGRITAGQILYGGKDLLAMPENERREVRGKDIAIVFQDALSALNPVFTVGHQIS